MLSIDVTSSAYCVSVGCAVVLRTRFTLQAQLAQAEEDATDLHQALGTLRHQLQDQINLVQQGTQTQNQLQVQLKRYDNSSPCALLYCVQ